ncbi:hypothetical protein [Microbacterium aurantiacum]|uniref:hypothetical protein n=1 Tax=Microbacterium aurantiacum TaxID=162393 RepID=UPI003D7091B5
MTETTPKTIIVEVGGNGGVFQHSLAVADVLAESGVDVEFLGASDAEAVPSYAQFTPVFDWHRGKRLRGLRVIAGFVFHTIPSVARRKGTVWFQGSFRPELVLLAFIVFRALNRRVVFSPHNLFIRHGGWVQARALRACLRLASRVIVYNSADETELRSRSIPVLRLPLIQWAPEPSPSAVAKWRKHVREHDTRVLSIGQIRSDKNIPILIRACEMSRISLLIAGEGAGGAEVEAKEAATRSSARVIVMDEYLSMSDLVALLAVVRLVALPYSLSSQSGVAALAHRYGARTLGYAVGGLVDQVDVKIGSLEPEDWSRALSNELDRRQLEGALEPVRQSEDREAYLDALGSLHE